MPYHDVRNVVKAVDSNAASGVIGLPSITRFAMPPACAIAQSRAAHGRVLVNSRRVPRVVSTIGMMRVELLSEARSSWYW